MDPGKLPAALVETPGRDEIESKGVRCEGCGFGFKVAVMPWSPRIAKAACPRCDRVTEIETRPSGMDFIDRAIEEGEDQAKMRKRRSVHFTRSNRFVATKLGRAALIDP